MYNRYIPRSDGSYQRRTVKPAPNNTKPAPVCAPPPPRQEPAPAGNFLQQLLPKDFDTEDLIIVLLLLLLSGDDPEERGTAMLTLALYLFL